MISLTFALSKLLRKKLTEVLKYSEYFYEYKYVKVKRANTVLFAKNIFQYTFNPKRIDTVTALELIGITNAKGTSINQKIDYLFAGIVAKKYDLSLENSNNVTVRTLLTKGALKEHLYVEKYTNHIYGFVKDKYSALTLSIIEVLDSAKNVVTQSTDRIEVIIKNAILRELSLLRSPPNRTSIGLLRVA